MQQMFKVQVEDLSYPSAHKNVYVYAEDEADAIIQVFDIVDVKVQVHGIPSKATKADILDAAREPLSKFKEWLHG